MRTPALPSAVQNGLTPASTTRAPSVDAVVAALAAKAALTIFTSVAAGLVPASGGGTSNFLRADGVWAEPPGGGGGGGGAVSSVFGRAGAVTAQSNDYTFAQLASKPTTLAGYGIVDATPLTHVGAGGGAHADVVESGASGFMTGTMAAKLAGIAAGATANLSDAALLARANHTGTQTASTISDLNESVLDFLGAGNGIVAGANISLVYNDVANTLTINSAGEGGGATLADGNYGDVTSSSTGTVITINAGVVTFAKIQNLSTDTIMGRDTAGSGPPEALTLTGGLEFSGSGSIQTAAFVGDVTKSGGGTTLNIANAAVTYAKFQNIGTDTLIGRDTAGTGSPEAIALNVTLSMDGAGNLQRAALTGDVTASAGSNATTIANQAVSLAKMANLAQDQFIGRVTASTGVPETATITSAARTVLDDTTVAAMVNTLGGATSSGTGGLVRITGASLVTPDIGVATGTSLSLGGGTALATTNRTGTGNLVLATAPTLVNLVMSGIFTSDSASVTTANAIGALAIDVTKGLNTKSISTDSTFTFSGTPATANTWFYLLVTNTDSAPHIITIPGSVFDLGKQVTSATFPIAANGRLFIAFHYNGSTYNAMGTGPYLNKYDATTAPGVGDDVADGYGPGSFWLNATSNIAYICESNGAGAAVWNTLGGGVSDANYGDLTVSGGVWTINAGVVTMAKLANIATDSLIGRDAASSGVPIAITVTGGIEFSGSDSIRTSAFTGDVTKSAGGTALTIATAAVSLAKMADIATARFIGRTSGGTGVPEALTATQATALLDLFTTGGVKGLVPGSSGGTSQFLRADGSWASPAGAGTVTNTGNLTLNSLVLGNATTDTKVAAGFTTDGTSKLTLGVAGVSVGGLLLANATSGTIELRATTGALGTTVATFPAGTDTVVMLAATQSLDNKTLSSPRITTAIFDSNGNEVADITATSSAVNQLSLINSATGNSVQIATAGGDTNIGLNLNPKGSGAVFIKGNAISLAASFTTVNANPLSLTTTGTTNVTLPTSGTLGLTNNGKHLVPVMAGGMTPSASGGCAALAAIASAANQPDIVTLDFDTTTEEYAQFSIPMPESWDEGTLTFQPIWSHPSTTTNFGVVWSLQAVAVSDDDGIAVAYGTAVTSTDTGGTTNDVYVGPESSAMTVAGTPANKDTVFFRIFRTPGNGSDTLAVDARLHGIRLYLTTNAETDA